MLLHVERTRWRIGRTMACLAATWSILAPVVAHESIRAEFETEDGVHIVGDYWTPVDTSRPAAVVILLHMYRSDRSAWEALIVPLEEAGLAILALDLRGHGDSTRPRSMRLVQRVVDRDAEVFRAMHLDVAAALAWLADRPEVDLERVGVVGASVGCSVALDSAARDPRIDVTVLLTPGTGYLGLNSLEHVERYGSRPVMMLAAREELETGALPLAARLSERVAEAYRSQSGSLRPRTRTPPVADAPTPAVIVSDASRGADVTLGVFAERTIHGTQMLGRVTFEGPRPVERLIADYLREHLGTNPAAGDAP